MKKIAVIVALIITLKSITSIAKYSNTIEYNFLAINILVVEDNYSNTSLPSKNSSRSGSSIYSCTTSNNYTTDTYIDSDIFIDTNSNIQIQITK